MAISRGGYYSNPLRWMSVEIDRKHERIAAEKRAQDVEARDLRRREAAALEALARVKASSAAPSPDEAASRELGAASPALVAAALPTDSERDFDRAMEKA